MTDLDGITVVPGPSEEFLNDRQLVDFRSQREACLQWLLTFGKDPDEVDGYARSIVNTRASRMDIFYRWVWEEEGRYVADVTHDHADAFLQHLAYEDRSNADRSNYLKALQMLFKWRRHEHGLPEWDPALTFHSNDGATQPRDYLTREERTAIREAALEYGSIPSYSDLSPAERDRWKAYLAQRFEKPKTAVTPLDWDRANGWKIPSLVATGLDAGLRHIEVERARTYWVDVPNRVLRIPKDEPFRDAVRDFVTSTDANEVYDALVTYAEQALECDVCRIATIADDEAELVPRSTSATEPVDQAGPVSVSQTIAGDAYKTGTASIIDDLTFTRSAEADTADHSQPTDRKRSVLTAPIGDYGVFQAFDHRP